MSVEVEVCWSVPMLFVVCVSVVCSVMWVLLLILPGCNNTGDLDAITQEISCEPTYFITILLCDCIQVGSTIYKIGKHTEELPIGYFANF